MPEGKGAGTSLQKGDTRCVLRPPPVPMYREATVGTAPQRTFILA